MKKFMKALSAVTIASFAGAYTACGEDTTAGVTEEAAGIAENSSDSEDEDLSSSSKGDKVESSSSKGGKVESSSSNGDEPVKFSGKISGVSQKGPFLVGSSITLHEIDGASFDLSGRTFVEKIKNDKGEFELSFKELSSNYALIVADGFYRNENSGKKSTASIKLNALSDLTDRKTVNVNLLTHLEYDRVKYLVLSKNVEYAKAKAQAEKEILEAFGMAAEGGSVAEDLSIFGESKNDGALLALSVLMQGSSAEGDFSERLALVAQDLEEDGDIDDEQIKADIADEVALMDLNKVRENIEGWKISTTVPEFEDFVEIFWTTNYGIGVCTVEDISKTAKNTNKLSKNFEKTYVCDADGWREMKTLEEQLGACTSANNRAGLSDGGKFHVCNNSAWEKVDRYEYDMLTIDCSKDGLVYSDLNDAYYLCAEGQATAPTFDNLAIDKDFTADLWNGATDSKVKIGDDEFPITGRATENMLGKRGSIFNSKGEKVESSGDYIKLPVYDDDGSSSTLADKGIKYRYDAPAISANDYEYVTTGFSMLKSGKGIDATDWEGLCVVYASSVQLLLDITAAENRIPEDMNQVRLPASAELTVANFKWNEFTDYPKGGSYEDITKTLASIALVMERYESYNAIAPQQGVVYIAGIGKYNGCTVK